MAMLHIIRSSAFTSNALKQCLSMCFSDDSILLMDDGCYNLNHALLLEAQVKQSAKRVYFIGFHASARAQKNTNDTFTAITLTEVIALLFQYDNSITWS